LNYRFGSHSLVQAAVKALAQSLAQDDEFLSSVLRLTNPGLSCPAPVWEQVSKYSLDPAPQAGSQVLCRALIWS
jgi:hypothetical protein